MNDKIIDWFCTGDTGTSSKAMAAAVCGNKPDPVWSKCNHPRDPSDFDRCVKFLIAVPEARQHMDKVAALSPIWKALVDNWDELERMLFAEAANPQDKEYRLYHKMKSLGC